MRIIIGGPLPSEAILMQHTFQTKTKPAAGARAIARSYDECSEADKMLLDLRDAGEGWAKIRHEWEKLTGEKIGSSTLPNRYGRLKSNFTVIKEEDHGRLLEAKRNVEQAFEKGKWSMVAEAVEKMGGDKYPVCTICCALAIWRD